MPLTARQRRIAEEFALDLNATRATARAGYSARTASEQGARLLVHVGVAAEVERLRRERAERTALDRAYVLGRLQSEAERRWKGSSHAARVRGTEQFGRRRSEAAFRQRRGYRQPRPTVETSPS